MRAALPRTPRPWPPLGVHTGWLRGSDERLPRRAGAGRAALAPGGLDRVPASISPLPRRSSQFSGKDLLNGQTDGSSFPNGGLRATHRAGAYLTVDPESPPFIMNDTVFIPSVLAAYSGVALDEKVPLHRAVQSLSKEGVRLLGHLGLKTKGLVNNIGLEQEIFLISRDAYYARPDLQFTGRTVMGAFPARGQEMSDHYMAPLSESTPALACMQAIQDKCFKMGIPLRTRHREVAPNQYEFAPVRLSLRISRCLLLALTRSLSILLLCRCLAPS